MTRASGSDSARGVSTACRLVQLPELPEPLGQGQADPAVAGVGLQEPPQLGRDLLRVPDRTADLAPDQGLIDPQRDEPRQRLELVEEFGPPHLQRIDGDELPPGRREPRVEVESRGDRRPRPRAGDVARSEASPCSRNAIAGSPPPARRCRPDPLGCAGRRRSPAGPGPPPGRWPMPRRSTMRRSRPAAVEGSFAPSTTTPVSTRRTEIRVRSRLGSIGVRADHLTPGAGPDGPPGLEVDRILDEPDRTVGHGTC